MSDLIVSINFDESKKKNKIVIETFEGNIPKFKSRKYSGQLRNVNINKINIYDNVGNVELKQITAFLNKNLNIQISKYQYLIANKNILELNILIDLQCLFYREKKKGMFQVTHAFFDSIMISPSYEIEGLKFGGENTKIYFIIDHNKKEQKAMNIQPKAYIDLGSKEYPLDLIFEYDNFSVYFTNKDRNLFGNNVYRDFSFEKRIEDYIKSCGWKHKNMEEFKYFGENIILDISRLLSYGMSVYTNAEKKIAFSDFSNIHVSYNLDWFNINGKVKYDNEDIDISDLLNLKKKTENWVEYNGKVIFLPKIFNSKYILIDKTCKKIKIEKRHIVDAISVAHGINGSSVQNLENFIRYDEVAYDIDENINKLLRPYQKVGVQWLLSLRKNGFGACLADDMGLGKTLQIIAFLSEKSMSNSCNLIVVPKTLLINWQREIRKFSPLTTLYIYHGSDRKSMLIGDYKIVISTYRTIVNDIELFKEYKFDNLIIDEAQYIKNSKSKAYHALKNINASMKIILTGTPLENNLEEYWGLMRLINPDIIGSYKSISQIETGIAEKIKMMTSPFLLRRLKKDVLENLPKKQEQVLYVKMDTEQQALYDQMLESIRYEILRKNEKYEIKSNSIMLNGLLYLQEICCHPKLLNREYNEKACSESAKLELLMDLLNTLYYNGHKVVIFSRFTKMLKLIEKRIVAKHINYSYLDGKTKDRMTVIDEFEHNEQSVFLISLKAGGTGINLTSADTVIIYDPWWNPASEKQAEDRIYRIGQKKNVIIYRLIAEGTIEEKIQRLQNEKIELCSQILDGHEIPISLTAEIMEQLIMD